ncbi:MAG: universal stress protein [Pseudomonadota bacterium]
MSYKTILVQVDHSERSAERVRLAVALAGQYQAHLVGAAATGISAYIFPGGWGGDGLGYTEFLAAHLDALREQAKLAAAAFDALLKNQDVRSSESLMIDEEAGVGLSARGRYSDLIVVGQTRPEQTALATPPDLPEYLIMNSGRPVLIVPFAGTFASVGRRPLIAWDGSLSATHAVAAALPLLTRAERVDVAVYTGDKADVHGAQPGDDIALYLARHDVKVNVIRCDGAIGVGEPLLTLAGDRASDLIVMGGYGHARMREFVMGGVTRTMLRRMSVPVLMAH